MKKEGALKRLNFPSKGKYLAMLAPSFIVDFSYPEIILALKKLGFSKVVELTFGAKIVNSKYHQILKKKQFFISSVCPGVVETIKNKFPNYEKNLIKIDSPMAAMAKVCKKYYPSYKLVFISPCNFKKTEAKSIDEIYSVIDFNELSQIFLSNNIFLNELKVDCTGLCFDKFYNDYTKIYPLAGGLAKTSNFKGVLKKSEYVSIDGILNVTNFLEEYSLGKHKKIRFLDCNFCKGGCIGGPCVNSKKLIFLRKRKVIKYLNKSKKEDILEERKGLLRKAKGINFESKYL